jgi:hypothetical protein
MAMTQITLILAAAARAVAKALLPLAKATAMRR